MKYLNELWEHIEAVHFSDQDSTELERLFRLTDERIVFDTAVASGEIISLKDFEIMLIQTMKRALDTTIAMYQSETDKETIRETVTQVFIESFDAATQVFMENTLATIAKKAH